jgi:putative nucleotidyltransferase with HDIG domain
MKLRIQFYVAFVVALAVGCAALVYRQQPHVTDGSLEAIALLSLLAVIAECLVFLLPISARGSIAFIPYFATILVVPSWMALVVIAAVKLITDTIARRETIKNIFNAAQHSLFLGLAILVYERLGGISLLALGQASLLETSATTGVPALLAFAAAYFANGLLVSGAIAITKSLEVGAIWRSNSLPTLWLDILSVPLIFVFAWVYSAFGAIAAAALWVPILGLRQVHKMNLELERTNEELLELMVKSMEARDLYTSGHSRRVQQYSILIARAVGLSEREIGQVNRAALLHDVGKIHEKYGPILAKADRLSNEEWAVIREHPIDGANLVATMSRLRELVSPIRHHHENWNGTGYPDGLAGELIPLASRIVRLADTIDAMTTNRPYRQSLSEAEVRAELVRCRGQEFDPAITDKLLSSPLWSQLFRPTTRPEVPALSVWGRRRPARTLSA